MTKFNELALCSVINIEWHSLKGEKYTALLATPVAGKVPHKRLLHIPFLTGMEQACNGDYYLMNIATTNVDEKHGQQFRWTMVAKIQDEINDLIKELGPPAILNAENTSQSYIETNNYLEKEKLRYETETKYFKAKAHTKHIQNDSKSAKNSNETQGYDVKGFDEHDIYTAFDGDTDSMNEFLGNH